MSLKEQERDILVNLYLSKCDETLNDARLTRDQGRWNTSANRLYYALFHAITALFVSDGIPVHSHNGMKIKFGKEYVLTGLATDEEGKLLSKMETMRERADYDATFTATEAIINERFDQVEQMIQHIKVLIKRTR
jgi:uncharacterized protein (UPF0332 family)